MDGEILDAVTEWGTRSVADGVPGLYDLADAEFSGAVTDGTAWAFFLNGRVVGIFDGDIEDFEDASLTAYTAPDVSLPLLYTMQERGGETRGQYYSNDTPLHEIDETLSSGNFVGYVELSENVLSGDYYVVYYGGRSLPVAFVGNNRRRLTGDEAFERADDEVGIYSVIDADVSVVDLPERPEPEPTDSGAAGAVAADTDESAISDADESGGVDAPADEATGEGGDRTPDWATPDVAAETSEGDTSTAADDSTAADEPVDASTPDEDPSTAAKESVDASTADSADASATADAQSDASAEEAEPSPTGREDGELPDAGDASEVAASVDAERLRRELDAARAAKAEAEAERDRLADERDDYRETVAQLRDRIESLEAEIDRLEAEASAADAAPERTLAPDEALSGTNLFVRYRDKAEGTVERAAEGRISAAELRDNLRLEHHTEFETDGLRVDGRSFEAFLQETTEHRFAEWLLTSLVYEVRRTDSRAGLAKLYEAIERIDRIDLDGEVSVETDDAVSFDVVFRDKMGDPLFVASFDDSRDPTRAESVESLLDRSRSVSEREETLAAAFFVTTSFFDADAMEVAVDATRGGLFSRSSRSSYVKLSRKSGFHLCLVEARDEDFFLTVPEL